MLPNAQSVYEHVSVKNTFLDFGADDNETLFSRSELRRSASDSDIMSAGLHSNQSSLSGSNRSVAPSNTTGSTSKIPLAEYLSRTASSPASSVRSTDVSRGYPMGSKPTGSHRAESHTSWTDDNQSNEETPRSSRDPHIKTKVKDSRDLVADRFLINVLHCETGEELHVLENLAKNGLLSKIPRDESGVPTSVGSIMHIEGDTPGELCKPCVFWFKGKCSKGIRCRHCHFKHKGQKSKRIRASKQTRQMMAIERNYDNEQEEAEEALHITPTYNDHPRYEISEDPRNRKIISL